MPDPTLTEIAATVRKHAPGALPDSLHTGPAGPGFFSESTTGREKLRLLPDDIARHVLGFAMVVGGSISRFEEPHGWTAQIEEPESVTAEYFLDEDHGNDPLLSLYAAWRWARGIE